MTMLEHVERANSARQERSVLSGAFACLCAMTSLFCKSRARSARPAAVDVACVAYLYDFGVGFPTSKSLMVFYGFSTYYT